MKLFLLLLILFTAPAYAGVEQLGEEEFRRLATELSPKVNLFRDAWEKDPAAEFYGGTTRDYLYWVKGKFRDANTPADAARIAAELRALPVIDVRDFIIGESDVDIFTKEQYPIRAEDYGVRKIDLQSPAALDPTTELGQNEMHQGFIPAEKIRLGQGGFQESLGDGVREIYSGKLTVHFALPELFAETKYAKEGLNHPILLAVRYLRLQAMDYHQSFGNGLPDRAQLLGRIDPASAAEVKRVIESTLDGKVLKEYLGRSKFRAWLNGGIQKAFRSYTNPDAARMLMEEFKVTELPNLYPEVESVNQYVFRQNRDEAAIEANLKKFGVDEEEFFLEPRSEFPDGFLYHGTKDEKAFRSILFQGVLGSSGGSAGEGLYGVALPNREFSEKWAGDKARLIRFPVSDEAHIVNIESGEGERVWRIFKKADFEKFAADFGIDILRYPYNPSAYVVKNSAVLGRAEGVHRQLLSLGQLLEKVKGMTDPDAFFGLVDVNNLRAPEVALLLRQADLDPASLEKAFREKRLREPFMKYILSSAAWSQRADLVRFLVDEQIPAPLPQADSIRKRSPDIQTLFTQVLAAPPWREQEDLLVELAPRIAVPDEFLTQFISNGEIRAMPKLFARLAPMVNPDRAAGALRGAFFTNVDAGRKWAPYPELVRSLIDRRAAMGDRNSASASVLAELLSKPPWAGQQDLLEHFISRFGIRETIGAILLSPHWATADRAYYDQLLERAFREKGADHRLAVVLAAPHNAGRTDLLDVLLARGEAEREIADTFLSSHAWRASRARILDVLMRSRTLSWPLVKKAAETFEPGEEKILAVGVDRTVGNLASMGFKNFVLELERLPPEIRALPSVRAAVDQSIVTDLQIYKGSQGTYEAYRIGATRVTAARSSVARDLWEASEDSWGKESEYSPVREKLIGLILPYAETGADEAYRTADRVLKNPVWEPILGDAARKALRQFLIRAVKLPLDADKYKLLYELLADHSSLLQENAVKAELHRLLAKHAERDRHLQAVPAMLLWRAGERSGEVDKVVQAYASHAHLEPKLDEANYALEKEAQRFVRAELAKLQLPGDCPDLFARTKVKP